MNQRGVALPTALLALALLMALMLAFAALTRTEPVIAENQLKSARARALAEAGLERAIWALSSPTVSGGLSDPLPTQMPVAYNGTFVALSSLGGFTLSVTNGSTSNERTVVSVGWTPNNDATDPAPKGVKKIQATVMKLRNVDPPCAFCVNGGLSIGGHATVDARGGACAGGAAAIGGTMTTGPTTRTGNSHLIYGPGNNTANEEPADIASNVASSNFGFKLTDEEIAILKGVAKANGSYYQGIKSFDSDSNPPLKNGLVFVDTTTGNPVTSTTPASELGGLTLSGDLNWRGWIIVAGTITIRGDPTLTGMVYAQNDLDVGGSPTVTGALIAENRKATSTASLDSSDIGSSTIIYDCAAVRDGGGTIPQNWFVKPGTYTEIAGQ